MTSFLHSIHPALIAILLFAAIIVFYFGGLRTARYKRDRNPGEKMKGLGPFEGAMLGLISLLLGFTFNKSASYYDTRKTQLVHETNAIETVLLRADMYPDSTRTLFRSDMKAYITSRIQYYESGDETAISSALKNAKAISEKIWLRAAMISQTDPAVVKSMQMVPAINDMMDAMSSREEARTAQVPDSILWLLLVLCSAGSFIVGYAGKSTKADWIVLCSYSLLTVMTIYLVLDLDQSRNGMINTQDTHENMHGLLEHFK